MRDSETNSAFQDFYMAKRALVTRVVAIDCPKEHVADVAMKVWGSVQKKWPLTGIRNVDAYLTTTAQNAVAQFLRDSNAQKRIPPKEQRPLPDEQPSGERLNPALIKDPEITGKIDGKNLTANFRILAEELSGDTSDIMKRFLRDPKSVSSEQFQRLKRRAKKKVEELGEDIDPLKEGPSFLGHIAKKIRNSK